MRWTRQRKRAFSTHRSGSCSKKPTPLGLGRNSSSGGGRWLHMMCAEGAAQRAQAEDKAELDRKSSKICAENGCSKVPHFNFEDAKTNVLPLYCANHAQRGMVNVKGTKCESFYCKRKKLSFNFEGRKKDRFCKEHKLEGM
mmetsp:Transcript_56885/g.83253  ORF Transcript_56885/g.83253 Transcript_56885/m.83253 type:complete len:141 (-) Transcript_56885:145-567(-)